MFKNYFKTALRSLWKNKIFGFLTIAGLTIGIATAALISAKDLAKVELRMDKTVCERSEIPLLSFVSFVFRDNTKNN